MCHLFSSVACSLCLLVPKKRKIKELPSLGPSERVEESACVPCEKTEAHENMVFEKTAEGVTIDAELPALKESAVRATYSESEEFIAASSMNYAECQLEVDDTMQEKKFTHSVNYVQSACDEYAKQNHVNVLGSSLKDKVISKSSINDSCSVPENLSADSNEYCENQGSSNDLAENGCLDVASSDKDIVCCQGNSTNSSVEVQSHESLNEIHVLSDDISPAKPEIIDGKGRLHDNLSDSCSESIISDCRDAVDVEQLRSSSTNSEEIILGCEEDIGTIKLSECSELNSVPEGLNCTVPESLNCTVPEIYLEKSCSRELSDGENEVEVSEQVSEVLTSHENSVCDQSGEEGIPNTDNVTTALSKSENIVEENGERFLNCENEDKTGIEEVKDCVEECIPDVRVKIKDGEKYAVVTNGNDENVCNEDESVVSSLPDDTIPETENITTDDGSVECNELSTDPLSPALEWMPEEKSRSSVTVSSSVSLSDSAPLSPTLTVDEEFTNLDDASKGASTESEKLRTCDSMDSVKSSITNLLSSEKLERDHLDNVIVPSKNPVTDLSKPFSGITSPQPDITASISNENLNMGLRSIERQLSSSPSRIVNHLDGRLEGSPDSGKGSDVNAVVDLKPSLNTSSYYIYEFELPQELCGRLIGKQGKYVKYIKERSNSNVLIKRHPFNPQLKLVIVEGTRSDVNNALELIRKKFPPSQFPNVSLAQTHILGAPAVPESSQLHLPDGGVSCDVILSSLVNAGHFFLQQPTHPTYPSLSTLDTCMMACYSQMETPRLPQPVEAGVICAATIMNGWYRAQIVYVYESGEECDIKFVDYGGFSQVPVASLRQIRSDFMSLPFQASECYLANVVPQNEELGWTPEASAAFEELAQGQILQAVVVNYADDGVPYVELYRVQGITSTFINQELVDLGVAKWVASH